MADKWASPQAEEKAGELGVALEDVEATGKDGGATVEDVQQASSGADDAQVSSGQPKDEDKLIIAKFNPRLGDLPRLVLRDQEGNARVFSERDEQSMLMSQSQLKEFNEVNKNPQGFNYLLQSRTVS